MVRGSGEDRQPLTADVVGFGELNVARPLASRGHLGDHDVHGTDLEQAILRHLFRLAREIAYAPDARRLPIDEPLQPVRQAENERVRTDLRLPAQRFDFGTGGRMREEQIAHQRGRMRDLLLRVGARLEAGRHGVAFAGVPPEKRAEPGVGHAPRPLHVDGPGVVVQGDDRAHPRRTDRREHVAVVGERGIVELAGLRL